MAVTEAPAGTRWTAQWKELYEEVITTGLCTGCAGCVVTCPHDVIGYEHEEGKYIPFHLEDELGPSDCIHGVKGCTTCTRACPRFRAWEPAADLHLFGRVREPDEMAGIWRQLLLTRATDARQHELGQDGGFVSAMLIWLMEHDYIEAAMVSGVEPDDAWKAKPVLAHNPAEVLATAGSRYTYCANPLALRDAKAEGLTRLALVGMGCQTSSPPVMWDRKAGKVSKPFLFNIGLLCSKTFDDAIFPELFEAKYGLVKSEMLKMNIKGVFQIWMKDGAYHEIDLKECHQWTREGCKRCPDFAAEHADIATGGIGVDNDWTLTIVRTELGEEVINRMIADGTILSRPAQEDEKAMKLLRTLSIVSRRRWPESADPAPKVGVPRRRRRRPPPATGLSDPGPSADWRRSSSSRCGEGAERGAVLVATGGLLGPNHRAERRHMDRQGRILGHGEPVGVGEDVRVAVRAGRREHDVDVADVGDQRPRTGGGEEGAAMGNSTPSGSLGLRNRAWIDRSALASRSRLSRSVEGVTSTSWVRIGAPCRRAATPPITTKSTA